MIDFDNIQDIDDEIDELEQLEDLFDDLPYGEPTREQMYKLYGVFLKDIVKNPITINGVKLNFNRNKSKHPICHGKFVGFEHIITRKNKYSGKRDFDRERTNKIHWIKPIIENKNDSRIKYFEKVNNKGFNQQYYWYKEKSYIVIIRELKSDLLLITAFSVDTMEKSKYQKYYNEYNEK